MDFEAHAAYETSLLVSGRWRRVISMVSIAARGGRPAR
jgi:hypothetical protein